MTSKIIKIAVAALIIIGAYFTFAHYRNQGNAKTETDKLTVASKKDFKVEPTAKFKDTAGHEHFQAPAHANTFSQSTIDKNDQISLGGADTSAMALGIQRKQIEYWKQIAMQSGAEKLKASKTIDSLKRKVLYYRDKYIEITYHPGVDSTDNGTFGYKKRDSLRIVQFWKSKYKLFPFFRQSFLDISSTDKNTQITGYEAFEVKDDPSAFLLHGQVKTSYDFSSGNIIPSAGLELTLGKFVFGGRYYYSQKYQKLQPIVSATYNFLTIK